LQWTVWEQRWTDKGDQDGRANINQCPQEELTMKKRASMKTRFKVVTATIGVGVIGAVFAAQANAGCYDLQQKVAPSPWQQQQSGQGQARFLSTAFVQVSDQGADTTSIVGLWKFAFTAEGNTNGIPDGTPIDAGYVTWHADGTELTNSGRAPTTGDFCMGVWKLVGPSTYKLNHFALAWAFDANAPVTGPGTGGADFIGPANIRERVTLGPNGSTYKGTFTLTQYEPDGVTVVPPTPIIGTVKATRITVDE
jgi:hypothetical protein